MTSAKAVAAARNARTRADLALIVTKAARALTGAQGATFVVSNGEECKYLEEDAIEPLWKGQTFPSSLCISGWVMQHRRSTIIPDIAEDPRVPYNIYKHTFVRSLAMAPIMDGERARGAIGLYWSKPRSADAAAVAVLEQLAAASLKAFDVL